jgi:hypothetical protein
MIIFMLLLRSIGMDELIYDLAVLWYLPPEEKKIRGVAIDFQSFSPSVHAESNQ